MRIALVSFLSALGLLSASARAVASCPPDAPRPRKIVTPEERDEAGALYDAGLRLLNEGKFQSAYELLRRSRELRPHWKNVKAAAICLLKLGREHEALALYEELLVDEELGAKLPDDEREAIDAGVRDLRRTIALVMLEGDDGDADIDGEACGPLPRPRPIYLRPGEHTLKIVRRGEKDILQRFSVDPGKTIVVRVPPRPPPPSGQWTLEAFGGVALGGSLESSVERDLLDGVHACGDACPFAAGYFIGARGGYRGTKGVSLSLAMGLLNVESTFETSEPIQYGANGQTKARYALQHDLRFFAQFMGPSLAYRSALGERLSVHVAATAGLLAVQSADALDGTVIAGEASGAAIVGGRGAIVRSATPFVWPELGLGVHMGPLRVGIALGMLFTFEDGPLFQSRTAAVDRSAYACSNSGAASDLGCVPAVREADRETAYGPLVLFLPQLTVGLAR